MLTEVAGLSIEVMKTVASNAITDEIYLVVVFSNKCCCCAFVRGLLTINSGILPS